MPGETKIALFRLLEAVHCYYLSTNVLRNGTLVGR